MSADILDKPIVLSLNRAWQVTRQAIFERGGRDSFENLVWAKKEINSLKANRLPHEAGLRLRRRPQAPASLPASAAIREAKHPDWRHFFTH